MKESFIKQIEGETAMISSLHKSAKNMLSALPDGTLRIHRRGGKVSFEVKESNGTVKYLSSRNSKRLRILIKKYCASRIIALSEASLRKLKRDPMSYDPSVFQKEYLEFENIFGDMTPDQFLCDESYLKRWQERPFISYDRPVEASRAYITDRGETVRSKNEALCANLLNRLNIPYHYEEILKLKDGCRFPDFTTISPVDKRLRYLEICGMMDNPVYTADLAKKLTQYGKNGIFMGDSLLVFFEFGDESLDLPLIERTLRRVILHEQDR